MSLVEQALEKARAAHERRHEAAVRVATTDNAAAKVVESEALGTATHAPMQRIVASPDIRISDATWQVLGYRADPGHLHQQQSEFRHIKRQILKEVKASDSVRNRVLVVASALPGEGKTFTAANLALSLAREPDYVVLIVDADVIKPQLSKLFGLHDMPGLLNAALDASINVETLIKTTDVEGLSVLPAGGGNKDATEAFGSKRMGQVLQQLLDVPNRLIVVDTLPLLLTTESRVLMPHAGQILLVVRSDSTPKSAVDQAVELLDDDANVKVVLNAVERNRRSGYSGYYGYRYNYDAQS